MKYSCNEARESGVNLSSSDRQKLYNGIKKIRFLDTELSEIKNRAILHWPRFFLFSLFGKRNRTEQNGTEPDLRVKKRGKVGMFRWRGKDRPCSTNCSLIGRFSPRLNKGGQAGRRNIVVKFPSRYSIPVKRCDKLSPSIFPLLFVLLPSPLLEVLECVEKKRFYRSLALCETVGKFAQKFLPSNFDSNISLNDTRCE